MKISKLLNMYEEVVSMANFKAKKGGEDETLVHINSVIITGCEGPNNDDRFPFGQEISLEEAQTLINKEDYKKYIQGMGCDKCFFQPKFTVNGEEKSVSDYLKYSSELRVDLHDGAKYGYEHISIIENLKAVLEHSGLKNIIIDNKEIPYDKAALEKEFGTKEDAMQKYVDSHKIELPQGKGCADKTLDEIAVGDIFQDSDYSDYSRSYYYDFYRVVKKTLKSVWFEPLKRQRVEEPVIKDGRIDYQGYQYPSEEVDADKQGKGYHLMDFSKPFRLTTKYDNKVKAEQGAGRYKVTLYPWSGTALAEEFKMKKSIYAKLNEKFAKFFEEELEAPKASNEIARKLDEPVIITRCNNCMTYLDPEVKECPKCKTDAYLMDMSKADLDHQGIDVNKITVEESLNEIKIDTIDAAQKASQGRIDNIERQISDLNTQKEKEISRQNKFIQALENRKDDGYFIDIYDEFDDAPLCPLCKRYTNKEDAVAIFKTLNTEADCIKFANNNDPDFPVDNVMAVQYYEVYHKKVINSEIKFFDEWFKNRWEKEVTNESLNEEKEKLDIRELIEGYNFSIIKTRVPEQEVLEKSGMDEFDIGDYEGHVGEPCFVLYDNMKYEVRAIFLGETLTPQISIDIAENLDTFINDSIWEDVVDNFIPDEDRAGLHDFPELFEYLKSHDTGVSEWETTVVEMLATGNKDLFKEITDMKEEDFKETFGIHESLKESKKAKLFKKNDKIIFDTHGQDSELNCRSGQKATVLRPLTDEEADIEDVGNMYKIKFEDGYERDAFEDELKLDESLNEDEDTLKKIADEIKAEIEKIYADDKDLLEYFHVEPGVKKGHYDDGSDMNYIEVRTELGYDELMDLSEKLDKIVQKYDKYAYFDMEGGGIITAVIDNDLINESLNEAETYPKMLTTLIKKCWYGNGRFARNGKWSIGLGGYNHGYEVYFDGDTICQIKPDNEVYFGRSEDVIKEICGYDFEQILKAIQEVESDAFIKEDEYKLIIEFEEEYLDEIYNIINKLDIAVDEQYNTFYGIYSNNEDELDEIASKIKDADKNGHFNIRVIEV